MDEKSSQKVRDQRRYYLIELSENEQAKILSFFNKNKSKIINDVLKGNTAPMTDYMLVVQKNGNGLEKSNIVSIEKVIKHYDGLTTITRRGNLKLGKITVQRKGGNGGGITAQMLQFKFFPKGVLSL